VPEPAPYERDRFSLRPRVGTHTLTRQAIGVGQHARPCRLNTYLLC